ncbi:UNVERIFIED_CONTAM: hypothetical protein NCL1_19638 [Trichonephila clavipes]
MVIFTNCIFYVGMYILKVTFIYKENYNKQDFSNKIVHGIFIFCIIEFDWITQILNLKKC